MLSQLENSEMMKILWKEMGQMVPQEAKQWV